MKGMAFAALLLAAGVTPAVSAGYNDLNAGIAYFNDDNSAEAISHFDKAIAAGDLIADQMHVAYADRGRAYIQQNEPDKAVADFTAALALQPADTTTLAERAFAYVAADQPEKSLADLAVLQQRKPNDIQVNLQAGLVEWQLGRYAEASTAFSIASMDGHYAYPWLWLQLANIRQGKSITPFHGPQLDRPGLHMKQVVSFGWPQPLLSFYAGDKDEASVLEAVKGDGGTEATICEANFYLAEWRLVHGDTAGAKPMMQRAIADCPKSYVELRMARLEMKKMP